MDISFILLSPNLPKRMDNERGFALTHKPSQSAPVAVWNPA
jgi:hypothetical protein